MRDVVYWLMMAWSGYAALHLVTQVGKPRTAITGGVAAFSVALTGLFMAGITWLAHP